jgi:hypothetical protein
MSLNYDWINIKLKGVFIMRKKFLQASKLKSLIRTYVAAIAVIGSTIVLPTFSANAHEFTGGVTRALGEYKNVSLTARLVIASFDPLTTYRVGADVVHTMNKQDAARFSLGDDTIVKTLVLSVDPNGVQLHPRVNDDITVGLISNVQLPGADGPVLCGFARTLTQADLDGTLSSLVAKMVPLSMMLGMNNTCVIN